MTRYKKWATAGIAVTIVAVVEGCGQAIGGTDGGTTSDSNSTSNEVTNTVTTSTANATNITTNTTGSTPSSTVPSQVLVTIPLTNGKLTPSISFQVPTGWTKQKVWQGDTSGYAWVNPNDSNQQIDLITSGNMGAIKNYTTGQWDVTGIFGQGTNGVSWTNVSTDNLTASFTDTRGINPYAKNEQTPYTGYGKAFIVQNPNSFSVYVEVWGTQSLANAVLPTLQLHTAVYVFSQPMLEEIYAVKYFSSVGPIIPPAHVQQKVNQWAPKVSMNMLPYAPASEQALDQQLIQNIQGSLRNPPKMQLLKNLPGYTLHHDQVPSGTRTYWYPSNNQFPTWVDPVQK